jgi:hypothetical protein
MEFEFVVGLVETELPNRESTFERLSSKQDTTALVSIVVGLGTIRVNTLAARGLEEHNMRITLIFARIISFMLFTVLLSLMYFISKNF